MRRILPVAAVILAVLVTATSASAKPLLPANCNCGSLYANGDGWVGETATGAVLGNVGSGTLWVRDNPDHFVVSHYASRTWVNSIKAWKYRGNNMVFQAWGSWWVKAKGIGVAVSTTAEGTASLEGDGRYHLNGGSGRDWPSSTPRRIQLRG